MTLVLVILAIALIAMILTLFATALITANHRQQPLPPLPEPVSHSQVHQVQVPPPLQLQVPPPAPQIRPTQLRRPTAPAQEPAPQDQLFVPKGLIRHNLPANTPANQPAEQGSFVAKRRRESRPPEPEKEFTGRIAASGKTCFLTGQPRATCTCDGCVKSREGHVS